MIESDTITGVGASGTVRDANPPVMRAACRTAGTPSPPNHVERAFLDRDLREPEALAAVIEGARELGVEIEGAGDTGRRSATGSARRGGETEMLTWGVALKFGIARGEVREELGDGVELVGEEDLGLLAATSLVAPVQV